MIPIVVTSKLALFHDASVAYPARVDVTVAKLVREFALDFFGLDFGVTISAETHGIFILPRAVEMWAAYWIAFLWWFARVVSTFLTDVDVALSAR